MLEMPGQFDVREQAAGLAVRPDFLAVIGRKKLRRELAEVGGEVVDVPLQHVGGVVVGPRVDRLRQVDAHRHASGPSPSIDLESTRDIE